MKRRDWEYSQPAHCQLGGTRGKGQEAFGVGQLSSLQTGQVAPEAKQIHVKLLQVLLPQEDLQRETGQRIHLIVDQAFSQLQINIKHLLSSAAAPLEANLLSLCLMVGFLLGQ